MGHWTDEESKNAKLLIINFAKKRNFDPFVADNWYKFSGNDIKKEVLIVIIIFY